MLRHRQEELREENAPPSAEEFARAVMTLEAKRSADAEQALRSEAFRATLEEVSSDLSEPEVLSEVDRQRAAEKAAAESARQARANRTMRKRVAATVATILAVPCLYLGVRAVSLAQREASSERLAKVSARALEEEQVPVTFALSPQTLVLDGDSTVRTLAEVQEGREVRVEVNDLELGGQVRSANELLLHRQDRSRWWTLVKHGGKIYLRAYTSLPLSAEALRTGRLVLLNRPTKGSIEFLKQGPNSAHMEKIAISEPQRITVPLETIRFIRPRGGVRVNDVGWLYVEDGIRPDSHVTEGRQLARGEDRCQDTSRSGRFRASGTRSFAARTVGSTPSR